MTVINTTETIKRKQALIATLRKEVNDLRAKRKENWEAVIEANKVKKAEREAKAAERAKTKAEKDAIKAAKAAEREASKAERVAKLEAKLAALKQKKAPLTKEAMRKLGAATSDKLQ